MKVRRVLGIDRAANARRRDSGTSQGVDLAATVLLFVLLGLFLDAQLGTRPLCTVVLAVFAGVGGTATAWIRYQTKIAELDKDKPWTRKQAREAA